MEQINLNYKDFNTISPSARWLLLMKGHTNIPFARKAAELIEYPDKYTPDLNRRDLTFWARTMHFEIRYWSIDQLLADLPIKNILELSSGYSFRGLEIIRQNSFYYIDTDLPEVITIKNKLVTAIKKDLKYDGKLELIPLNVLNDKQFHEVVNNFPSGELVIVNEGLLMYLDTNEKEKLCMTIYDILKERHGYWIVADIYIKNQKSKLNLKIDNKLRGYYERHKIEDNKFESFEEAEIFFKRMGFVIDKEAKIKRSMLSSFKYLLKSLTVKHLFALFKARKIRATWRLRIATD